MPRFGLASAGVAGVAVLLFVAGAAADSEPSVVPTGAPSPEPAAAAPQVTTTDLVLPVAAPDSTLSLLATLAVKGRAPRTGYDRRLFGPAWADTDRNGCDTRNDLLQRDLTEVSFMAGTRDCVVVAGRLADPYTGRTIVFRKADAGAVQIDHVVALSDAWQKGAQQWDAGTRLAFANDPLTLLAVDGPSNAAKSDADAATWLPPNKAYRCAMVARQTAVKAKYGLWVTAAERDAIARVLSACPDEPAPTSAHPTTVSARR